MIDDWTPLFLSLKLACTATLLLFIIGIPLSAWLAFTQSPIAIVARALIMLPLVLPPSVVGFYLLVAWNPQAPIGAAIERATGIRLIFTFEGLVAASVITGLPFMINPVTAGFESIPRSLVEAAATLGKNRLQILWHVLLPSSRPSVLLGVVMTFIHTFGEFGIVLMIGGKIPGETLTSSVALYDLVESFQYRQAHVYAAFLISCSLLALLGLFVLEQKRRKGVS